jgi:hypothetical protein
MGGWSPVLRVSLWSREEGEGHRGARGGAWQGTGQVVSGGVMRWVAGGGRGHLTGCRSRQTSSTAEVQPADLPIILNTLRWLSRRRKAAGLGGPGLSPGMGAGQARKDPGHLAHGGHGVPMIPCTPEMD